MLKNRINGKIYIGQTIRSINERLKQHRKKGSGCVAIYNAIKFHGWENFEIDYYECPDEDLNFDEELLVREMRTLSPEGYNLREGGGNRGKASEESKQKMKKSHLGKPKSEEQKQKMSDARIGELNPNFGKTISEEQKQKISEAKKGEKNPMSKRVYQYDLDGTFMDSFASAGEASRYLNKYATNIILCALYKRKTAHKFKWSYTMDIFI